MPLEAFSPGGSFGTAAKLLIYGASGAGKTRFAGTAPKPLFADAEKGMASVTKDAARWPIDSIADFGALMKYLEGTPDTPGNPDGFQTVVIDSINEIQRLLNEYVLEHDPDVGKRPFRGQQMNQGDWGFALNLLENRVVRRLKNLPINVIMIATTAGTTSAEGKIEPALYGRNTVSMVTRYADVVGYMHTRSREGAESTTDHVIRFHMAHAVSKDRSGKLPAELVDPTWDKLASFWTPKSPTPIATAQGASSTDNAKKVSA